MGYLGAWRGGNFGPSGTFLPSVGVTLGYAMITFTLGGLNIWMPTYLPGIQRVEPAACNLLLCGSVAWPEGWAP